MRKISNRKSKSLPTLAALTLTMSLTALGCTTNRNPGSGEPISTTPSAGPTAPSSSLTPGSSGPTTPQSMVSASRPASSVDAQAEAAAARAYNGVVLGPAAPGTGAQVGVAAPEVTGQFQSPSVLANPQLTVNNSISSPAVPAIVSGAAGDDGLFADGAATTTGIATTAGITSGTAATTGALTTGSTANGVTNTGATGLSNATATPIAVGTTGATGANVVGNGLVTAPRPLGNVVATPTFGTSPRVSVDNAAAAGVRSPAPTVGDASVVTGLSGSNQTANGRVVRGTTGGMTAGSSGTGAASRSAVAGTGTATMRGVSSGSTATGPATAGTTASARNLRVNGTTSSGSANASNLRVEQSANGSVTVTNVPRQSFVTRALRAMGIRRATTTSTGTTGSTTTNP